MSGGRPLWTVEGLVNNRGHEVEHYTYDAYGLPVIKSVDYRDVNYDGLRDVADRNLILTKVSQAPCTAGPIYDLDGDGDIDSVDAYRAYSTTEAQLRYSALVSLDASGIGNPYLFTGQPLDAIDSESLYLYHYRARAYDPTHGRFMQRDPKKYIDSMNLYEYVKSNPIINTDPSGKYGKDVHFYLTWFLAEAAGFSGPECKLSSQQVGQEVQRVDEDERGPWNGKKQA